MDSFFVILNYLFIKYKSLIDLFLFISSISVIIFFIIQYIINKNERKENLHREFIYKIDIDPNIEIINNYFSKVFSAVLELSKALKTDDIDEILPSYNNLKEALNYADEELIIFLLSTIDIRRSFTDFLKLEDEIANEIFNKNNYNYNVLNKFYLKKENVIFNISKKLFIKKNKLLKYCLISFMLVMSVLFVRYITISPYEILFSKSGVRYSEILDFTEINSIQIDHNKTKLKKLFVHETKGSERIILKKVIKYTFSDNLGYAKDTIISFYTEDGKYYKCLDDIK